MSDDELDFQAMRERLHKLEEQGKELERRIEEFRRLLENLTKKEKPPK